MPTLYRIAIATAALLFASALPAGAQTAIEREFKALSGKSVRVGVYSDIRPDCTPGPLPAIRLVTPPAHGAVHVKHGRLKVTNYKQCLAIEVPVFVAFYRAAEGFSGRDEFVLEVGIAGGRKQLQHFRMDVSSHSGKGQAI